MSNQNIKKVLFVGSGNTPDGISIIVKNQGESLRRMGVDVDYFAIKGRGLKGYLRNIPTMKDYIKENNFDIIHAHYSLSAYVASLAGAKPLIVSLMGSDIQKKLPGKLILKSFYLMSWQSLIVKSNRMKKKLGLKKCHIIPNGVNFELLRPIKKSTALAHVDFNPRKRHVVFISDPLRYEKNYKLAKQAVDLLKREDVELNVVSGVSYEKIPYYLNAADVLILTSLWEGSPNVIKEAMACNLPIVSTDVGDVGELTGKTEGCYMASFEPEDVAEKLKMALSFGKRTDGREHIRHLDSHEIAGKIKKLYEEVLEK